MTPEPIKNPNPWFLVDPPGVVRRVIRKMFDGVVLSDRIDATRLKVEVARKKSGTPHTVEYFHQFDDPYSHLTAQILKIFAARYDVEIKAHYIGATGGKMQPEPDKLAHWALRDAAMIAPYYKLDFPAAPPLRPATNMVAKAVAKAASLSFDDLAQTLPSLSHALWSGEAINGSEAEGAAALQAGNARLAELQHYSGATFYYGGEWYWGVERLLHLEQRLRDLGLCRDPSASLICPRPTIAIDHVDATGVELDFYASLNSPYTAIAFDTTVALAKSCGASLHFKPVLPMLMRGLPVPKSKGMYLLFDTKREADLLGVPFGPVMLPVGKPTRQIYALLPWAKKQGKDLALMSNALRMAFSEGAGLHRTQGMRRAVEAAGLDWSEAKKRLSDEAWKPLVAGHQQEMDDLGLWGVPSYRLHGDGMHDDLCIWGQDRMWLIAAEIEKRAKARQTSSA